MRLGFKLAILIGLAVFLMVNSSSALLPNFTKQELIEKSDAIVLGVVKDIRCSWADDHRQIFTYVSLQVLDQFKGQAFGPDLLVQIPGGTVGETTQWVSDTPKLSVGMQVILHIYMHDNGYHRIYGWEKGALQVENDVIPGYGMTVDQFRSLVANTK